MAFFSGEVTIKVKFKEISVPVVGMTSAIIKHKCVEQSYFRKVSRKSYLKI